MREKSAPVSETNPCWTTPWGERPAERHIARSGYRDCPKDLLQEGCWDVVLGSESNRFRLQLTHGCTLIVRGLLRELPEVWRFSAVLHSGPRHAEHSMLVKLFILDRTGTMRMKLRCEFGLPDPACLNCIKFCCGDSNGARKEVIELIEPNVLIFGNHLYPAGEQLQGLPPSRHAGETPGWDTRIEETCSTPPTGLRSYDWTSREEGELFFAHGKVVPPWSGARRALPGPSRPKAEFPHGVSWRQQRLATWR